MPVGEPLFLSAASSEGHEAFVRATVVAQRTDGSLRVRTDGNKERVCRLGVDAWPAGETEAPASSSLLNVAYLHTPALLHNLKQRFELDSGFASWIGPDALLWLHPCGQVPDLFTTKQMMRAAAATSDVLADVAHPYALAERAMRTVRGVDDGATRAAGASGASGGKSSVAILLHGETGAGQSDLFVQVASHWLWRASDPYGTASGASSSLAEVRPSGSVPAASLARALDAGAGEAAMVLAHGEVVLAAFGGARTRRHASTPRFGRWLRVALDGRGAATAVALTPFGLERSRVVDGGGEHEGNFHAYYAVLHLHELQYYRGGAGGGGSQPRDFLMLRSFTSKADSAHRTAADLSRLTDALGRGGLGCTGREIAHLWRLLEGILHLGNLMFRELSVGVDASDPYDPEERSPDAPYDDEGVNATLSAQAAQLESCASLLGLPHLSSLLWEAEIGGGGGGGGGVGGVGDVGGVCGSDPVMGGARAPTVVRRTPAQAAEVRRALMEELHAALFDILTAKLNAALTRAVSRAHTLASTGAAAEAARSNLGDGISTGGAVRRATGSTDGHATELLLLSPPPAEALQVNGLPQLLANYASERLHAALVGRLLAGEQRRYSDEGLSWAEVPLPELGAVLGLLDGRADSFATTATTASTATGTGESDDAGTASARSAPRQLPTPLLTQLDLHARGNTRMGGTAQTQSAAASFCAELRRTHRRSPAISDADTRGGGGAARARLHHAEGLGSREAFVVHHTAGPLVYDARALLAGSRGASLSRKCKLILLEASNLLLKQIGDAYLHPASGGGRPSNVCGGSACSTVAGLGAARRGATRSVGSAFTADFRAALHACELGVVRHALCVLPNASEVPSLFEPRTVLSQLVAMGVPAAVYFLANAYNEHLALLAVTGRLRSAAPPSWAHLAPRAFVHTLLVAYGMRHGRQFQIGRTAAFIRTQPRWGGAEAHSRVVQLMRMPESAAKAELRRLHAEGAMRQFHATLMLKAWTRRWVVRRRQARGGARPEASEHAVKKPRLRPPQPAPPPMTVYAPPSTPLIARADHGAGGALLAPAGASACATQAAPSAAATGGQVDLELVMETGACAPTLLPGAHSQSGSEFVTLSGLEAMSDAATRASAPCPPEWGRDAPLGHARLTLVQPHQAQRDGRRMGATAGAHRTSAQRTVWPDDDDVSDEEAVELAPSSAVVGLAKVMGASALRRVGKALSFGRRSSRGGSRRGSLAGSVHSPSSPPASPPPSPPRAPSCSSVGARASTVGTAHHASGDGRAGSQEKLSWLEWVANGLLDGVGTAGQAHPDGGTGHRPGGHREERSRSRAPRSSLSGVSRRRHRSASGSRHGPEEALRQSEGGALWGWRGEDESFHQQMLCHTDMRRHHYRRLQQGRAPPSRHDYPRGSERHQRRAEQASDSPRGYRRDDGGGGVHHRQASSQGRRTIEREADRFDRSGSEGEEDPLPPRRMSSSTASSVQEGEHRHVRAPSALLDENMDAGLDDGSDGAEPLVAAIPSRAAKDVDRRQSQSAAIEPTPAAGESSDFVRAPGEDEATDVRLLSATLRTWDRSSLTGAFLPQLVALPDPAKAVALMTLVRARGLSSLTLRDCRLGERSASSIGEILAASVPISFLDLRDNLIGERGLAAVAAGVQQEGSLVEMRLQHALGKPIAPPSVAALAAAASRCRSLRVIWLGETDAGAAGSDGPVARLQRALLLNVEEAAAERLPSLAWGHKPDPLRRFRPASPASLSPSPGAKRSSVSTSTSATPVASLSEQEAQDDDGVMAALKALRQGKIRTLRLSHDAAAARASLPRQLELLRSLGACASLRIAQLVNVGLGDAWAYALAAALPKLRPLRILDVSFNFIGSDAARAIARALPSNHSLLWLQLLPQWLPLEYDAEQAMGGALSDRRIKLDLAIKGARSVISSRGDVGEPSVAFEWRGAMMSTGAAHPTSTTANPRWDEHFVVCVPASLLWPPSRTPLALAVVDLRRSSQLASDATMGTCELPLGSLLLVDSATNVRCSLLRHASAAPVATRANAELDLELRLLHVGSPHPDDGDQGVPLAYRQALVEERRAEFAAATRLQARWRGCNLRGVLGRRRKLHAELSSVAGVAEQALARSAGGRLCLALRRCQFAMLGGVGRSLSHSPKGDDGISGPSRAPLLPMSVTRSDAVGAAEKGASKDADVAADSDRWHRRRTMMRILLCLLCSSVCTLLAGTAVLFVLLRMRVSDHAPGLANDGHLALALE